MSPLLVIPTKRLANLTLILLITVVVLLSFRAFAAFQTPYLNSDHAVHVLMASDLQLPGDLYYWGQDRLGSIVPILAHGLLRITPLSPIEAVSYVHYGFLILGFVFLTSLFKTTLAKLLFGLAWFLPLDSFTAIVMVAQPYGPQFACLGLALALLNRLSVAPPTAKALWQQQGGLAIATASLFLSLWISDLAVVTLVILLGLAIQMVLLPRLRSILAPAADGRTSDLGQRLHGSGLIPSSVTIGLVFALGLGLIAYAKSQAPTRMKYRSLASGSETAGIIHQLWSSWLDTLTWQNPNRWINIHGTLVVVLVAVLICTAIATVVKQRRISLPTSPWFYLFGLTAALSFIGLLFLKWVYINDVSLRYFCVVYLSCWMAALFLMEHLAGRTRQMTQVLLTLVAIASSLSLDYPFHLNAPQPKFQQLQPIQSLAPAGFIAEYWSSYLLCTVNPKALNCTPRDPRQQTACIPPQQLKPRQKRIRGVRCERCARNVLNADTIYLVKNDWFETFPPEIQQFGQCLTQVGGPRTVAGYTMAPYRKKSG